MCVPIPVYMSCIYMYIIVAASFSKIRTSTYGRRFVTKKQQQQKYVDKIKIKHYNTACQHDHDFVKVQLWLAPPKS